MGTFAIAIILVLLLVIVFSKKDDKRAAPSGNKNKPNRTARRPDFDDPSSIKREYLQDASAWLNERWVRAEQKKGDPEDTEFGAWYYEEPTERQLKFIKELGVSKMAKGKSKGQVSDLIGLFNEPETFQLEVMMFFKIPSRGISQTEARDAVGKLLSDAEKRAAWEQRPPTTMQREFYKFFGLPVPKGITLQQMKEDIDTKLEEMGDDVSEEWDYFETVYDDLVDPEFRKDLELKKVSLAIYRVYIKKKRDLGIKLSDLDSYEVAEELLDQHPGLQRM